MDITGIDLEECAACGLSARVPGVRFAENGHCQYCRHQGGETLSDTRREAWRQRFLDLIAGIPRESAYDCLMSYSGGKDSTYTLLMLRQDYGLRVLAVVFDQGFISDRARRNIETVANTAGVDCMIVQPSFSALRDLFVASLTTNLYSPKAIERTSSVCVSCMSLIKGTMLGIAIERHIPLIAYGWSPGQTNIKTSILRMNPELVEAVQSPIQQAVRSVVGDRLDGYFLQPYHLRNAGAFPTYVHPLAFEHYDEEVIYRRIKNAGWVMPGDTDFTSTNCLLNSFANMTHITQYGFHPYAHEYASLVRQGVLSREEAAKRMESRASDEITDWVMDRLNMPGKQTTNPEVDR